MNIAQWDAESLERVVGRFVHLGTRVEVVEDGWCRPTIPKLLTVCCGTLKMSPHFLLEDRISGFMIGSTQVFMQL